MEAFLLQHESAIRYYVFIAVFGLVALAEAYAPRVRLGGDTARRWTVNLGLTILANAVLWLLYPAMAVAVAAAERGHGLLAWPGLPPWLAFVLGLLALDLSRYVQHWLMHRVGALWRLHRVHHSDLDYDCSTGLRFHPLEGVLTAGANLALVAALGAPPLAVLVIECLYLAAPFFNHGNLYLPPALERALCSFLVTPEVHRIHHLALPAEDAANFGGLVPWWDRLFGTYLGAPSESPQRMGLADLPDPLGLAALLGLPFRRQAGPTNT